MFIISVQEVYSFWGLFVKKMYVDALDVSKLCEVQLRPHHLWIYSPDKKSDDYPWHHRNDIHKPVRVGINDGKPGAKSGADL